jgi:RHS repeat-associated protein
LTCTFLATESTETIENLFKLTGQYFDTEISEYYLRARQYDPYIARFTSKDLYPGDYNEPMTLHKYLYCLNDPINRVDTGGYSSRSIAKGIQQWTFEKYMDLWNAKMDPFDVKPGWRMGIKQGATRAIKHFISRGIQETGGRGLIALAPVEMGGAFLKAGPNMYVILYYRLLQNGMINAILWEDFGIESDLYDLQDFRSGL